MGRRLPFLFNMPALAAWPLAILTGLALLVGLLLIFGGTPYDQPVYVTALFGPVGMVPLIARWKRMSVFRWSIGTVVLAVGQVALQAIFIHPVIALLAVLYHQPPAPTLPPSQGIGGGAAANAGTADTTEKRPSPPESVVFLEAPPAPPGETRLLRHRQSRRRRPRH